MQERCGGSTRTRIARGQLGKIRIFIPSDPAEQTAIATVLSDMDDDIVAIETKLAETQQLKQGMMQELLTGRTRFV